MGQGKSVLDWLSYPRAFAVSVFAAAHTLVLSIVVVVMAFLTRSQKALDTILVYVWPRPLLWLSGVRVEIRGAENVRRGGKGFLLLFNHTSMVDILVLYGYFPRPFRFGAKIELFKIPFFGKAMEVCGILPIDRGNRNKVMKVYGQAISRVNNGECFALAPEGTRQEESTLGKFKRGPFEFAINAGMDIVPVVVAGALKVLPKYSIWLNAGRFRRRIIVDIAAPVPASEYTMERVEELQERVRAEMAPRFVQLNAELSGF